MRDGIITHQQSRVSIKFAVLMVSLFGLGLALGAWLVSITQGTLPPSTSQQASRPKPSKHSQTTHSSLSAAKKSPTPTLEAAPAPPSPQALSFSEGRIAYLSCEINAAGEKTSCPRDLKFEDEVWQVLKELPSCQEFNSSEGEADLRIVFERGQSNSIKLLGQARQGKKRLDGPTVLACLRPKLKTITPSSAYRQLHIAFRFELLADSASVNN